MMVLFEHPHANVSATTVDYSFVYVAIRNTKTINQCTAFYNVVQCTILCAKAHIPCLEIPSIRKTNI